MLGELGEVGGRHELVYLRSALSVGERYFSWQSNGFVQVTHFPPRYQTCHTHTPPTQHLRPRPPIPTPNIQSHLENGDRRQMRPKFLELAFFLSPSSTHSHMALSLCLSSGAPLSLSNSLDTTMLWSLSLHPSPGLSSLAPSRQCRNLHRRASEATSFIWFGAHVMSFLSFLLGNFFFFCLLEAVGFLRADLNHLINAEQRKQDL